MEHLYIVLSMDLTPKAAEGPGWYVSAHSDGEYIVPQTAISPTAAYEASRAIQEALKSTEGELPQISIPQLVESSTKLIRQAVEQALQVAEEQAAKVAMLRKKLSKFTDNS